MNRVVHTEIVTDRVVATTTEAQDDVIEQYAPEFGVEVIRDSEPKVLNCFERAVEQYGPDAVVRVTGDCPLVSPQFIDMCRSNLKDGYQLRSGLERTFPAS